jgi:hypothetical protein
MPDVDDGKAISLQHWQAIAQSVWYNDRNKLAVFSISTMGNGIATSSRKPHPQ